MHFVDLQIRGFYFNPDNYHNFTDYVYSIVFQTTYTMDYFQSALKQEEVEEERRNQILKTLLGTGTQHQC